MCSVPLLVQPDTADTVRVSFCRAFAAVCCFYGVAHIALTAAATVNTNTTTGAGPHESETSARLGPSNEKSYDSTCASSTHTVRHIHGDHLSCTGHSKSGH
jgi:hypothetical protein